MSETPKISIILPTLNVKTYIRQCMDSVVNQTLRDIEILIVDAGSTDGTLEVLEDYADKDSRVTLLHSDKKSYGYQMNLAISKANGEYIGIVETDDYVAPEMFEELYRLSNDGAYDLVKSNFIYVNEDNGKIYKDKNSHKKKIPTNEVFNLKDDANILIGHPSIWSSIYKRKFLQLNGIKFMEAPGGGWVDNSFFFETICLAKTIIYTDDAYYYYRESNPDSSSNQLSDLTLPIRRMIENMDIIDKYSECRTEEVFKAVYWRVNVYLDNIQRRPDYEENLPILEPLIIEMLERVREPIFRKCSTIKSQQRYYSFLNPLATVEDENGDMVSPKKYQIDIRERNFYNRTVQKQQKEIKKLKRENRKKNREMKKLKKENKKLKKTKKLYDSLLNSSSWKVTKPLRGFFNLFR